MNLEIREFKISIENYVNKSGLPEEVKRMALKEIYEETEKKAAEAIREELENREAEEGKEEDQDE